MVSKLRAIFRVEIPVGRNYGLDIIRALAILFVVIHHGDYIIRPLIPNKTTLMLSLDGVSIFFVLSGFLIGGILIKTIKANGTTTPILVHFWIRRWFRTLPNYFLILSIIFFLRLLTNNLPDRIFEFYLFIQNFSKVHPLFFAESWSLSVEEWFYLLYPLMLFFVMRRLGLSLGKALPLIALIFIATSLGVRFYRYYVENLNSLHHWSDLYRKQVVTRMDSLMIGVLGAHVNRFINLPKKYHLFALILGLLLVYSGNLIQYFEPFEQDYFRAYYFVFSFSIESIGILLVFPFFLQLPKGHSKTYRFFTMISLISYSMYLLHLTLVRGYLLTVIDLSLDLHDSMLFMITKYLIYWTATILLSILLYKYFEIPTTALRKHFPLQRIKKWFASVN